MNDFQIERLDRVALLTPVSNAAWAWVGEHLAPDAQAWGKSIVIEPRFVDGVIGGITEENLTIG